MLWCVVCALTADAWATPLERVEFESASQRLIPDALIPGDRIQGDLAKPDGAGPFPAVVGLHGCPPDAAPGWVNLRRTHCE
jgi:hypothetical protein